MFFIILPKTEKEAEDIDKKTITNIRAYFILLHP
jgi:hypothetical protein